VLINRTQETKLIENRTYKFYGVGCGTTPVSVTATIGGTQVFSGTVPTQDIPINSTPPASEIKTVLFELSDSQTYGTQFQGSVPVTLEVTGGDGIVLGYIKSNWYSGKRKTDTMAGHEDNFNLCYYGTPTNSEGTTDPRSSVVINGATQVPPMVPSTGCWKWIIPTPCTITHDWNIGIGQIGEVLGNIEYFAGDYSTTTFYLRQAVRSLDDIEVALFVERKKGGGPDDWNTPLTPGVDYTIEGNMLTFTVPPPPPEPPKYDGIKVTYKSNK
jgi:hypothetical protein